MPKPATISSPSPRVSAWIVVAMLVMVAVPAALMLNTVRRPGVLAVAANPTPHGYTWSMLLFIISIAVIAFWFLPHEGGQILQKAFWRTIGILVSLGSHQPALGSDIGFALRLVGLPRERDAGRISWSMVAAAHRGRLCLDRSHLCDYHDVRDFETVASLGARGWGCTLVSKRLTRITGHVGFCSGAL